MCDFSLLDAIESGIVKLPRVPVADDVSGDDMPRYRELWKHIGPSMPKKGRAAAGRLDPLSLPPDLKGAIDALYSHYKKHFDAWQAEGIEVPPVFIVVCSNTATSKLVYDYIAGFERSDGVVVPGHLPLFRNYDEDGNRAPRPQTLLIDSEQLESGEALDKTFRNIAADEIERFRRERNERDGAGKEDAPITDAELLREAMNTVGKPGQLGESIRCVVSVAMLSEGWDANTVTHVLGVRAFGTQLLCEQVVGRGLRRQSYELNAETKRFDVEYADVLGIPFDFTAEPVVVPPVKPRQTIHVHAVSPDRDALAIEFPRVEGYTYEMSEKRVTANFTADSTLTLTPDLVGPKRTRNEGILGEGVVLTPEQSVATRKATVAFHLAKHLLFKHFRDTNEAPKLHLLGDLRCIAQQWLDEYLICEDGTTPGQILYTVIADEACDIIHRAIVAPSETGQGQEQVRAVLDPYNPRGSTAEVDFPARPRPTVGKQTRANATSTGRSATAIGNESSAASREKRVSILAYVKNQGMGFTVPYCSDGVPRQYVPDFIARVKDGGEEPVNLVVEIKGLRRQDAQDKADTMRSMWVPGVNALGDFGRWAFVEFKDIKTMEKDYHRWMAENAASPAVRAGHSLILAGGSEPNLQYIPRRRSKIW